MEDLDTSLNQNPHKGRARRRRAAGVIEAALNYVQQVQKRYGENSPRVRGRRPLSASWPRTSTRRLPPDSATFATPAR
jgi:hypothetical protein